MEWAGVSGKGVKEQVVNGGTDKDEGKLAGNVSGCVHAQGVFWQAYGTDCEESQGTAIGLDGG